MCTGCILPGGGEGTESGLHSTFSKGYRANLNIGRSAVPSGHLPRNRATRSPTCDPFCSFVRSIFNTRIIFSFLLRCVKPGQLFSPRVFRRDFRDRVKSQIMDRSRMSNRRVEPDSDQVVFNRDQIYLVEKFNFRIAIAI